MAYTPGSGSLLKVSISASFTTVAQQVEFGDIRKTRARIDVSGLGDTLEVLKFGIKRFQGLPFRAWYDPANATHQYLESSYGSGATESWKIVEADAGAAELTFSGWLEELNYGQHQVDGYVTIGGVIVLTTDITVTP